MLKITKMSINEGSKKFNVKDSENAQEKIEVIDGVVKVTKDKKTTNLKANSKRAKEILEACSCYEQRKMEQDAKKEQKFNNDVEQVFEQEAIKEVQENFDLEQQQEKIETIEAVEVVTNEEIEKEMGKNVQEEFENEIEKNGIELLSDEQVKAEQEKKEDVQEMNTSSVPTLGKIMEEKEKAHLLDVLLNQNYEYSNISFHISNIEIMVDARCKAHKEKIKDENGVESLQRFTNFTVYVGSDNKELNYQLIRAMSLVMEKKLECYGLLFDLENIVEYKRDNMDCMECILRIPYQSGISDVRKNVCKAYYEAKKLTLQLYRALKKLKAQQDKANKTA